MVLTETRLGANTVRNRLTPYENIPGASVLVLSPTIDASNGVGI
jgi:hypothetical protein